MQFEFTAVFGKRPRVATWTWLPSPAGTCSHSVYMNDNARRVSAVPSPGHQRVSGEEICRDLQVLPLETSVDSTTGLRF
jgi:hypothetical protein